MKQTPQQKTRAKMDRVMGYDSNREHEPERRSEKDSRSSSGYIATETATCKIVGADSTERTLIVELPDGVRGVTLGDTAIITLKRYTAAIGFIVSDGLNGLDFSEECGGGT